MTNIIIIINTIVSVNYKSLVYSFYFVELKIILMTNKNKLIKFDPVIYSRYFDFSDEILEKK